MHYSEFKILSIIYIYIRLKYFPVFFFQNTDFVSINIHTQSDVYWTVHHCDSWRIKNQLDVTCYIYFTS